MDTVSSYECVSSSTDPRVEKKQSTASFIAKHSVRLACLHLIHPGLVSVDVPVCLLFGLLCSFSYELWKGACSTDLQVHVVSPCMISLAVTSATL